MKRILRIGLISVLIACYLAGDMMWPIWPHCRWLPKPWELGIGLGFSIAQINLIATWAALGPGKLPVRLPWALLMGVSMWYALTLGGGSELGPNRELGEQILFLILVVQIPLWIANFGFGWRLLLPGGEPGTASDRQFRLFHLLAGTLLLCIALGLGRAVLPPGNQQKLPLNHQFWILHSIVGIGNLLLMSPYIWGAFARWTTLPLLAGMAIFYAWLISWLEAGVLAALLGGSRAEPFAVLCPLNLTQCATVWATLLLLRASGFRLVRRKD